jgi:hypothetical protein
MSDRLTQHLVDAGLLDRDLVNSAVEQQLARGGAIDTALLELALVEERDLLEAMAAVYPQRVASVPDTQEAEDPRASRVFPEPWAIKHLLAPLRLTPDGASLEVLSPAPVDGPTLERLAELLEVRVEPILAPEFRVHERLERLYGHPLPDRFEQLIHPDHRPRRKPTPPRNGPLPVTLSFSDTMSALGRAQSSDEVGSLYLTFARAHLQFAALFHVENGRLRAWQLPEGTGAHAVTTDLKTVSAFRVVLDGGVHYLGPPPSDPAHQAFLKSLRGSIPRTILLVPIRVGKSSPVLFLGDLGDQMIPPRVSADLVLLASHAQDALGKVWNESPPKEAIKTDDLLVQPTRSAAFEQELNALIQAQSDRQSKQSPPKTSSLVTDEILLASIPASLSEEESPEAVAVALDALTEAIRRAPSSANSSTRKVARYGDDDEDTWDDTSEVEGNLVVAEPEHFDKLQASLSGSLPRTLAPLELEISEAEPIPLVAESRKPVAGGGLTDVQALLETATPEQSLNARANPLLDALLAKPDRQAQLDLVQQLCALGPGVVPIAYRRFPGPLLWDPTETSSRPPPFRDAGPLLKVLAQFPAEAHPEMTRLVDSPDPMERTLAILFYRDHYLPQAIPKLIKRLHDEERRICLLAAEALFKYREIPEFQLVTDHLRGRLNANSLAARQHAVFLIGLFRDVSAFEKLIALLDQKDRALKETVARALTEIAKQDFGTSHWRWRRWWAKNRHKNRIEWLLEGLSSRSVELRGSAVHELRTLSGSHMGFDENASRRDRERGRLRWVEWWEGQKSLRTPPAS